MSKLLFLLFLLLLNAKSDQTLFVVLDNSRSECNSENRELLNNFIKNVSIPDCGYDIDMLCSNEVIEANNDVVILTHSSILDEITIDVTKNTIFIMDYYNECKENVYSIGHSRFLYKPIVNYFSSQENIIFIGDEQQFEFDYVKEVCLYNRVNCEMLSIDHSTDILSNFDKAVICYTGTNVTEAVYIISNIVKDQYRYVFLNYFSEKDLATLKALESFYISFPEPKYIDVSVNKKYVFSITSLDSLYIIYIYI